MRIWATTAIAVALALLPSVGLWAQAQSAKETPDDAGTGSLKRGAEINYFERKVRPILVRRCYSCHSQGKKQKGGLLLDTQQGWMDGGDSGPALEPGDPAKSLLIRAIRYSDEDLQMPPKGKLPDAEIQALVRWVKIGAPDPRTVDAKPVTRSKIDLEAGRKFWSFQPPRPVTPPAIKETEWPRAEMDHFVKAKLEAAGLRPVGEADRRTLIRRTSFVLTGLPPEDAEVEAFVADKAPDAFAKVVDRLLKSRRFGERWGRHWLDLARYAESTGKTRNYAYPFAWRYRNYVIQAFNDDTPYDQFVTEQVAGDLLPWNDTATRDRQRIATGFLALGPKDLNERNQAQYKMDNVDEQIDTTCRTILALTVNCARCHDHKFDPIPTRDYYAMAGVFGSTEIMAGLTSRRGGGNRNRGELFYRLGDGAANPEVTPTPEVAERDQDAGAEKRLAALKRELKQLQRQAGKRGNDKAKNKKNKRNKKNKARRGGQDAQLAKKVRTLRNQIKQLNKQINQKKRKKKNRKRAAPLPKGPLAMGVRDAANPRDCRVHIRGEVSNLGATVPRGFVQVVSGGPGQISDSESGRLQLARWLTRRDNPLTSRVLVNRVWHHLFGHGLVRTVDNFGTTGERPSHAALLDHLALKFMENGWSVKKLVRYILLSRTYQLSSDHHEGNYASDPDNRLLWRQNQRRLDAEAIRDAMLAVSGQLDTVPFKGSPVASVGGGEIGRGSKPPNLQAFLRRRSVYLPIVRSLVPEVLEVFDFADPSMVKGRRDVTTVANQALFLMNSRFVGQQSAHMAERLLRSEGHDDAGRVDQAYRIALGRPAAEDEVAQAASFVTSFSDDEEKKGDQSAAWSAFCQALLASAEFRYLN